MVLFIPRPRWLWSAYLLGDPPFLAQLDDSKLSAPLAPKTASVSARYNAVVILIRLLHLRLRRLQGVLQAQGKVCISFRHLGFDGR
jgi:hypothetical protein